MTPRRWGLLLVLALLAVVVGYGVGHWYLRRPAPALPAARVPTALPDLDGHMHALDEWRGKFVLLNFWATWCPPCREEIPLLVQAQRKFASRNLQIVSVAIDSPDAVAAFRDQMHIDYPILLGGDDALALTTHYGDSAGALPYSVFIAPNGQVVRHQIGAFESQELEKTLQELLPRKSR